MVPAASLSVAAAMDRMDSRALVWAADAATGAEVEGGPAALVDRAARQPVVAAFLESRRVQNAPCGRIARTDGGLLIGTAAW